MIYRLLMVLLLAAPSLLAQSQQDFEDYGESVYKLVTDPASEDAPDFIRRSEYGKLIAEQPVGPTQKMILRRELDEGYNDLYQAWSESFDQIKKSYTAQASEGAETEYLSSRFEPVKGSKDIYKVHTKFIFRKGPVQNLVSLYYDAAWISEYEYFTMMSSIEEDF